jgi:hypothetical protein
MKHLLAFFFLIAGTALTQDTPPEARTGDGWRMIQKSGSPDGRYALAWGQKGKSQPKIESGTLSSDFENDAELLNFVVDLKSGIVVGETAAKHPGDWARYNHESTQAAWSKHNRYVTQTMSWKWHSEVSVLYEIIGGKKLSKGTDLIEPAWTAAFQKMKGQPKFQKFKQADFGVIVFNTTFTETNEGTQVTIEIGGQTGKFEDDVTFSAIISFRVLPSTASSGPTLEWIETKLIEE